MPVALQELAAAHGRPSGNTRSRPNVRTCCAASTRLARQCSPHAATEAAAASAALTAALAVALCRRR
eukprot:365750-Chlamydomonas_euryale.AAC.20